MNINRSRSEDPIGTAPARPHAGARDEIALLRVATVRNQAGRSLPAIEHPHSSGVLVQANGGDEIVARNGYALALKRQLKKFCLTLGQVDRGLALAAVAQARVVEYGLQRFPALGARLAHTTAFDRDHARKPSDLAAIVHGQASSVLFGNAPNVRDVRGGAKNPAGPKGEALVRTGREVEHPCWSSKLPAARRHCPSRVASMRHAAAVVRTLPNIVAACRWLQIGNGSSALRGPNWAT